MPAPILLVVLVAMFDGEADVEAVDVRVVTVASAKPMQADRQQHVARLRIFISAPRLS